MSGYNARLKVLFFPAFVLKQERRLVLVAAYNIYDLPDHDGDVATIGACVLLIRSTPASV